MTSTDHDRLLGVLAFGDSITNGGGELQWGVALQSWALWVARGLGLPYTGYAVDGADVHHVVQWQIPAFQSLTAHPHAAYDLGCLYIGVNDVRRPGFDVARFASDYAIALEFLTARCRRTLTMTAPLDLGRPRAGAKVNELDAAIEEVARERGALVVDLRGLRSRNLIMADHVHPTALGQVAIAERALAVLEHDGLAPAIMPTALISYQTTRWGRMRGDLTYAYRRGKDRRERIGQSAGRRLRSRRAGGGPTPV
ncbi:MAG: GDSL-type esterase/lipase family protein [Actinomycetota bacterium]|nr:GDSL-type esterase/lipase family protein [Actinomycetota bacterium]